MTIKKLFPALGLLLLAGCGALQSTAPQTTIYSLRPAPQERSGQAAGTARVVEIAKPSVPPGFDTDRIALLLDGGRTTDYYAGATWAGPLDEVVREFTRRTASSVLPYVVTTTPGQLSGANYRLEIKLNEFQPVYAGAASGVPTLLVDADFTLVSLPSERIVRSFRLTRDGAATSDTLSDITAGLESMLREVEAEAFRKMDGQISRSQ